VKTWAGLSAGAILFAILATANAGGYRYGVSDQAFYQPAIAKTIDASLFPRDSEFLASQMRLWPGRHVFAGLARALPLDLPHVFLLVYGVTLGVLFAAAVGFARGLALGGWATAAFLALLTLRHQIARTGANSLEGYMHPRMLAFAVGVGALAFAVRRRHAAAVACIAAAALLHPTTALWFGVVVAVAAVSAFPRSRQLIAIGAGAVAVGAIVLGPLGGRLTIMDSAWLDVLASRTYLFPAAWSAETWAVNLAYPLVIGAIYRQRRAAGLAVAGEGALVTGLFALIAVFLLSVPLSAAGIALAVQLQVARTFWILDVVAAAYVAWWLVHTWARRRSAALVVVSLIVAVSCARAYYVLRVEHDRPLVAVSLPENEWTDAMRWLRGQPSAWHVLADPEHAWRYGASVRVAAARDILFEAGKDPALALYDRAVAVRVAERALALADPLTMERVRDLDARYALDVFVTEQGTAMDRPVLYRNARFVVYDLR
jgi:hypothetical protein